MAHWRLGSLVDFITLPAGKDFIQVDISVTGIGSSSTITGVGNYLKEKNPNAKFALCNMREGKHAAEEACRVDGSRTVRCYKHSRYSLLFSPCSGNRTSTYCLYKEHDMRVLLSREKKWAY